MKMKNVKFYGKKAVIWITLGDSVYRIDCNQLQFTDLRGDVIVSDIVVYFNGDISLSATNTFKKNRKLILKAFSLGIKVFDVLGNEVKIESIKKFKGGVN